MRDQDEVEQERQEAATETPAFLGCPQHMPTKLPGGFDGVEPGEKSKIEASITRMREKLSKIADIALAADAKCVNIEKLGVRYLECSKALCEIRMMCGRDLAEKAGIAAGTYYSPSWLGDLAKELGEKRHGDLEKMNDLLRNRLRKISDVADKAVMGIRTEEEHNLKLLGACTEIRQLVDFYKPRENEVVNPSRLDDIGMQMDKTTVVDDDGVVCKIRRAGVLMMGIGRPAQLWEIDATKHPTYCRVMIYCDHKPIFDGKAFGKNIHRAGLLGLAMMIRFIQVQRKHQRNNRKAAVKKLIKEELA